MATAGSFTKYRSWSTVESDDPNDIGRLYTPEPPTEKKIKRTFSTWAFSLIILSFSVVFLIGILVGYYLKPAEKDECKIGGRSDKFDLAKLANVHENIMYFISNDNVRRISSDLSLLKDKQTEYVKKEFLSYGLDRVEVQEYEVVVTYPDPSRPNQLVIINSTGQVLSNLTLGQTATTKQVQNILNNGKSVVTQLQPNVIQGQLVYGDYGGKMDLARKAGSLKGSILMVKEGGDISIREKVYLASKFEVKGILLQGTDEVHVLPDLSSYQKKNPVPIQIISDETARVLLAYYSVNNRNLTVRISSNNIQIKETAYNVVGSINGDLERDRFVVIGASRSEFSTQTGTSYMLELARSFKDMHKINGWIPRRSVKFYSWDHDGVTNIGFQKYLQQQNALLESSVVAYIDLDLQKNVSITGNNTQWLHIAGNQVFSTVVNSIIKEIPDPDNNDLVLNDTWVNVIHDISTTGSGMDQFGVPVFKAAMYPTYNLSQKSDSEHHYKYSLAISRVASLAALRFLDDEVISFNMTQWTKEIYLEILISIQYIRQRNINKLIDTDNLLEKVVEFSDAGRTFTEYTKQLIKSHDSLAIRRINDASMKVERIVLLPEEIREQNGLESQKISNVMKISSIKRLLSAAAFTNDYSDLQNIINYTAHLLQEVIYCLQSV